MHILTRQHVILLALAAILITLITLTATTATIIPFMKNRSDTMSLLSFHGNKDGLFCLELNPLFTQYTSFSPVEDRTLEFVIREPTSDPGLAKAHLGRLGFVVNKLASNRCFFKKVKTVYKNGIWRGSIYYQAADRGPYGFLFSLNMRGRPKEYWIRKAERALLQDTPMVFTILVYSFAFVAGFGVFSTAICWFLEKELGQKLLNGMRVRKPRRNSRKSGDIDQGREEQGRPPTDDPDSFELEVRAKSERTVPSRYHAISPDMQERQWRQEAQQRKTELEHEKILDQSKTRSNLTLQQCRRSREAQWTAHYQQRLRRANFVSGTMDKPKVKPVQMSEADIRRLAANDSRWHLALDRAHMQQAATTGNFRNVYINNTRTPAMATPRGEELDSEIGAWNTVLNMFRTG